MPRLYLVGLGLSPLYMTEATKRAIGDAQCVFADVYTSYFDYRALGVEARPLDRKELEDKGGAAIEECLKSGRNAALLVPGDPLAATAHAALVASMRAKGYEVVVVPGVSIICAAMSAACLSIYKLGGVATVTYPRMGVYSLRPYELARDNLSRGLHTLLLLDIRDEGGFMPPSDAARILMELEAREGAGVFIGRRQVVVAYRLGWPEGGVAVGTLEEVAQSDLPGPAVIIVPAALNPVESECISSLPKIGERRRKP
ncbi:MAG: diphthine synthase [Thermoproteus sp.]